jgi:hypothetical protein
MISEQEGDFDAGTLTPRLHRIDDHMCHRIDCTKGPVPERIAMARIENPAFV